MPAKNVIGQLYPSLILQIVLERFYATGQTSALRDSHLDLEIETLKENSHLILNLNSQFFCENSHSHSQLSFSNSQKFETSRLNLFYLVVIFLTSHINFDASIIKILIWRVIKDALKVLISSTIKSSAKFRPTWRQARRNLTSLKLTSCKRLTY